MPTYILVDAKGAIANRVTVDAAAVWAPPAGYTAVAETTTSMQIGGTYANGVYTPPLPPAPPIQPIADISRRQFYQQLAAQATITQAEALAAVSTGTLPASLVTVVSGLPIDQQFPAKMFLTAGNTFQRGHPMTAALANGYGWTPAQTDALFTNAIKL